MNPLTIRPDRLRRLRKVCLDLPDASEREAWGDPTWRVGDRIFAMQKGNSRGARPSLWLKAQDGAQAGLVQADPDVFFVPPYVGKHGWIGLYLDGGKIDWNLIRDLVRESYDLIASRARPKSRRRKAR